MLPEQFIHQFRIGFQSEALNGLSVNAKIGKMTVKPDAHAHSSIHIAGHCEQTSQDASQQIACAGLCKCLIAGLIDIEFPVGKSNNGIRSFKNNDYFIILCKCRSGIDLLITNDGYRQTGDRDLLSDFTAELTRALKK